MKTSYDENTLSAFMDGELDLQTMHEVDDFLENDVDTQQRLLGMVRKTALLRSASNDVLSEPVPERLLAAVSITENAPAAKPKWPGLLRVAAVFVLMIIGYGVGTQFNGKNDPLVPFSTSVLPQQYQDVVDAAMEHNRSGNPLAWQNDRTPDFRVIVTPVRTFQDKDGKYYREYKMEMSGDKEQVTMRGLAHRTGKAQWKTTALFF